MSKLDFFYVVSRSKKNGVTEIYPKFIVKKSKDLMTRGGDFYAIWNEEKGLWSTDEDDAIELIDAEIKNYYLEHKESIQGSIEVKYLWDADSGMIDNWHKYCQKQKRESFHPLDDSLVFSNHDTKKEDYATKKLNYPLEQGSMDAYEKLISTLYSPEERQKIEWAIGSIVSGDSRYIQKFIVLYGSAGTGKSTILNIIQKLFEGYYCVFDAKALGSSNSQFALEPFKNNPLVAIQHDGDLSRIEDNTRINSIVSHEQMTVNEKHKATYTSQFKSFLFMGTNKPVKITDAKSGIIRRLIDVSPSGNKVNHKEYKRLVKQIDFELGAIAYHCKDVYLSNPSMYDDYIPTTMMGASNDFYNFIEDSFLTFKQEDATSLKAAWEMYKNYCDYAKVTYSYPQRAFKEELKNYFDDFYDLYEVDGKKVRNYYTGFKQDKFVSKKTSDTNTTAQLLEFKSQESLFDKVCSEYPAQYATENGTPCKKWNSVTTKLRHLDSTKLHYVKVPKNHIVIDFDIPDELGNKCLEKNIEAASKWPKTYSELSKSGQGVHLHYIYAGDPSKLSNIYDEHIEIKVFDGNSSLRRMLTKCINNDIATINSGLPIKGDKKMISFENIQNEKSIRTLIKRNLNKEYHPGTKPSIDFIKKILDDAYKSGVNYDVSDLRNAVIAFAANSSHQADYCLKLVDKMNFKSENFSENINDEEAPIVFYDIEVFPNLFLVNWKFQGKDKPVVRMINPSPMDIEEILKYRLIGFNNRDYDNHMIYARYMGFDNEQLYTLSTKLINKDKQISRNAKFGEAYNLSYTDVYDFSAKKQSLKKWEIELGISHKELGLPWDQPVPEDKWVEVAEYCDNDVIATEAVYDHLEADFKARQIQVELVKSLHGIDAHVNETTNALSQKIIFGRNRSPQSEFNWRDLSKPVGSDRYEEYLDKFGADYKFRVFNEEGLPEYRDYIPGEKLPEGWSILPFFKGYQFDIKKAGSKSTYLGEEIGEGGRVYSRKGMYANVWDGDIASQHPHSAIYECVFGPKYTKIFKELVEARVAIKHKDFETAGSLLNGALKPFLNEEQAKDLAQALKIIINSIYGLTSAKFPNAFKDPNNIDNIVAKRGSLFMTLLTSEVQKQGYVVCHNKTDSIKIPNYDQYIMDFVIKFGNEYGYKFETEAIFDRFCLVNDAVYIARINDGEQKQWIATGTQFKVPYVFKYLFSKEPIVFEDMCETKSVKEGAIFLDFNEGLPDVSEFEEVIDLRRKPLDKLSKSKRELLERYSNLTDDDLYKEIDKGHKLSFVGRVGRFTPVKNGTGGGILYRINEGKKYAVTDTSGYRWMESEVIKEKNWEDLVDKSYYLNMVDKAKDTIMKYGDYDWFISDKPYKPNEDFIFTIESDTLPF